MTSRSGGVEDKSEYESAMHKKGGLKMASNIEIIRKQREVLPAESRHTVLKLLPPHLC